MTPESVLRRERWAELTPVLVRSLRRRHGGEITDEGRLGYRGNPSERIRHPYDGRVDAADHLRVPDGVDDWVGLTTGPLPLGAATEWAVRPECGAVVTFSGTARDHAEGRPGVTELAYEAYEEQVVPRLAAIAAEARGQWSLGRIALLHRVGPVAIGEAAVVVVASSAHRAEAFAAARFAIDRLKATAPIWKREVWQGGDDWGLDATPLDAAPLDASPHENPSLETAN